MCLFTHSRQCNHICTIRFHLLEEDIANSSQKGEFRCWGMYVDNVIAIFWEASCNSNGKLLIELLNNCDIMIRNGRTMLNDPQWT